MNREYMTKCHCVRFPLCVTVSHTPLSVKLGLNIKSWPRPRLCQKIEKHFCPWKHSRILFLFIVEMAFKAKIKRTACNTACALRSSTAWWIFAFRDHLGALQPSTEHHYVCCIHFSVLDRLTSNSTYSLGLCSWNCFPESHSYTPLIT